MRDDAPLEPSLRENTARENAARDAARSPGAARSAFRRALALTGPGAAGALTAAFIAHGSSEVARLAFGVALGALVGAGVSGYLAARRALAEAETERRPAAGPALNRFEARDEAAAQAAALIGGPTSGIPDALADARRIFERLPIALLLLDGRGRLMFVNPAARAEVGRARLGEHFSAALRAPALVEAVREAYAGRALAEIDFTQRRYQDRHFHAIIRSLAPGAAGAAGAEEADPLDEMRGQAQVIVMLQDQTRIRRAEQLHRDFVANASHELKTPLAAISGFIETLRGPAKDDAVARERFLGIMAQQSGRMQRLVEDLLSLNRIELNEHVPPREELDLLPLLRRLVAEHPEPGRERIEVDLPAALPLVRGDAAQLSQVFVNLIENALKYGGEGKPIRLEARISEAPRAKIAVTVEDFGPGVPKEHVPRLTERFYRVGDGKGAKSGTGLGLSIVKHATSRHRGELEIDSRLGRGSRFTVWLPQAADFDGAAPEADPGSVG